MTKPHSYSQRAAWAGESPISELMSRALASPQMISLAAGFVDQKTLPVEATQAALTAMFANRREAQAALQYGTTPGLPMLRELLASATCAADQAPIARTPHERIVVAAGSNQLLHLAADTLCDPGDIVLCAAPTYFVFLGALANLGVRAVGVAADDQGLVPDAVDEALAQCAARGELARVKAIYLVSYYDNPRGVTTTLARKAALVELARRWSQQRRIYVIEDAAYRELRYGGDDVPTALTVDPDGDTVVVAGTFSKSFSPGVRVGWLVLPEPLVEPICRQKGNIDFGSPNFSQHLMAEVLRQGLLAPHVAQLRHAYASKLHALLEALAEHFADTAVRWIIPHGGLYVWVELPPEIPTGPHSRLWRAAVEAGVLYVPGEYCYPGEGEPARPHTMRLSFGVQSEENLRRGVALLAEAVRAVG